MGSRSKFHLKTLRSCCDTCRQCWYLALACWCHLRCKHKQCSCRRLTSFRPIRRCWCRTVGVPLSAASVARTAVAMSVACLAFRSPTSIGSAAIVPSHTEPRQEESLFTRRSMTLPRWKKRCYRRQPCELIALLVRGEKLYRAEICPMPLIQLAHPGRVRLAPISRGCTLQSRIRETRHRHSRALPSFPRRRESSL